MSGPAAAGGRRRRPDGRRRRADGGALAVDHQVADDDHRPRRGAAHAPAAATAICARQRGVAQHEATFAARLAPPVSRWKRSSRNGVTSRPARPRRRRPPRGSRAARGRAAPGRAAGRPGAGWRPRCAVAETEVGAGARITAATSSRRLDPPRHRMAGVAEVEAGEARRCGSRRRVDVQGLEPLERRADVEDRLHPGAHDDDPRPRERREVGRLVPRLARAAVHAAEAAGREDADPGQGREVRGRGDRRRRVDAPRATARREVAHAGLDDVVAERDRRRARHRRGRSGRRPPTTRDRRRDGARRPHGGLRLARDAQVVRRREAVRDQRALQRDDAAPRAQGLGHLWVDDHARERCHRAARRGV